MIKVFFSKQVKILAFDIGNNFGYSYSFFDKSNKKIIVKETNVINLDKEYFRIGMENRLHDCMVDKGFIFSYIVEDLIKRINPDIILAEDIFLHQFLSAYKALNIYMYELERVCSKFNKKVYKIPTKKGKLSSGSGNNNKNDVKNFILSCKNIILKNKNISEHEYDSIILTYYFINKIFNI
jgi:hypothetical protein